MYFNTEDASFRASFIFDSTTGPIGRTELYMNNKEYYPNGFIIHAEVEGDSSGWTFMIQSGLKNNYHTLEYKQPKAIHGKVVTVTVVSKLTDSEY